MARSPHETIHGLRAGLAVISARPEDVVRVAFSRASARIVEPKTRILRARGVPCRMLADHELDRLAKVEQHEGLIVEANERPWSSTNEIAERVVRTNGFAVALDRVRNPYNVGAVLRSAAFFGAEGTIVGAPAQWPALDAQAVRVAEGGAERLLLARTTTLGDSLGEMKKKGVRVVGADGHAKNDAKDLRAPIVLVLGNEREGLHDRVRAQCDDLVAIRGSGSVESLNVAVAAGILLSRCAMG